MIVTNGRFIFLIYSIGRKGDILSNRKYVTENENSESVLVLENKKKFSFGRYIVFEIIF